MRQTNETKGYTARVRAWVTDAVGPRVRVVPDGEGFPIVPGRYGAVEYGGAEAAEDRRGEERLYVHTASRGVVPRLLAIPGVHRWQMGDGEWRLWFPAEDRGCLRAVCRTIKARRRRPSQASARSLANLRLRSTLRPNFGLKVSEEGEGMSSAACSGTAHA